MAAATADQTLYGFVYYLKRNPFKSIEAGMTNADLDAMLAAYVKVNTTDATLSAADPLSYGATQDFPKRDSTGAGWADGAGVSCTTPTTLITDQSHYPEQHYG
jgi:hypothetical protein